MDGIKLFDLQVDLPQEKAELINFKLVSGVVIVLN